MDFINYCVLGIGEFAQNHFDFQDWRIILYAIPVFALVGLIIANRKYGISLETKNILFMFYVSKFINWISNL